MSHEAATMHHFSVYTACNYGMQLWYAVWKFKDEKPTKFAQRTILACMHGS